MLANRVSRSNQLEKLRECLKGEALKQVPKNMTGGLESAWQALKVMFGDPERLLQFRLKALEDLGKFPPSMKNSLPNYSAQAAWLAPFLMELSEIISLGETHQELHNTVFNSSIINSIITSPSPNTLHFSVLLSLGIVGSHCGPIRDHPIVAQLVIRYIRVKVGS